MFLSRKQHDISVMRQKEKTVLGLQQRGLCKGLGQGLRALIPVAVMLTKVLVKLEMEKAIRRP